jgi:predicted neuraminidase
MSTTSSLPKKLQTIVWSSLLLAASLQAQPLFESEDIFPPESWHNHASSIVELPEGELMVCWYHGSGERKADDVVVEAARRPRGKKDWHPRFLLADTKAFPDTNPVLFVSRDHRLWLFWQAIVANEWHTAITKYKVSSAYGASEIPKWELSDIILAVPRNFERKVKDSLSLIPEKHRAESEKSASDKYFSRMGWMGRAHPLELPSGRILLPMYSDGYSFSVVGITDDGGQSWTMSEPIVGAGSIQPSIVRRKDGTLIAYMRDNGPAPKRIAVSTSSDEGVTWSPVTDTEFPNPGAGIEALVLADGKWVMVYNDTEKGRNSLAISMSDDEGKTWKWTRHIERRPEGSFHYPSIIQSGDGTLHVSYSAFTKAGKTIRHARFNADWITAGDR